MSNMCNDEQQKLLGRKSEFKVECRKMKKKPESRQEL